MKLLSSRLSQKELARLVMRVLGPSPFSSKSEKFFRPSKSAKLTGLTELVLGTASTAALQVVSDRLRHVRLPAVVVK